MQGDNWAPEYRQIHRRARLHAARLPPDQLNPRGHYDGRLRPVFSRFTRARKGRDERSGYLPLGLPPPGEQPCPGQSPNPDLLSRLCNDDIGGTALLLRDLFSKAVGLLSMKARPEPSGQLQAGKYGHMQV